MVLKHGGGGDATTNRSNSIYIESDEEADEDEPTAASFGRQILRVLEERDSKWILGLIAYNVVITYYLRRCVISTNSIALSAYVNTIFFNVLALLVCLISIWVELNSPANREFRKDAESLSMFGRSRLPLSSRYPEYRKCFTARLEGLWEKCDRSKWREEPIYRNGNVVEKLEKKSTSGSDGETFDPSSISVLGLEKYEVLALLFSSCLSLMAGSFVSVEVVARLSDQPSVHTGRLGLGALLGFLAHLGTILAYPDAGLNHVVCKALPCPTLRGCNPILGGNVIGAVILSGTHLVIHFWDIYITDTVAAVAVIGLTATSMLPLAFYTLNVILQKWPRHMSEQLDKCLREALIIDGVLEFRNERFWTKSFGKLAGTLEVRIRRNANENHVLGSVVHRLSRIVSTLTVQEFHESRMSDVTSDHPIEYYINEILARDENPKAQRQRVQSSSQEIYKDVKVMRIEDILGVEDASIETFVTQPVNKSKFSSQRTSERVTVRSNENVTRTLTIYENDNVLVKDRLHGRDATRKKALLFDTKISYERFENFSIADRNSSGRG